jgi:hypothetical protein
MNRIRSPRRWYLLQAADAISRLDFGLASALWGDQDAHAGTPLPVDTPKRATLVAAHYSCIEDLNGASSAELRRIIPLVAELAFTSADAALVFSFLGLTEPDDTDLVPTDPTHI